MAGVTGAEVNVGYAFSNTWGTPSSVTKGALIMSTAGLDGGPTIVDDGAFNQAFIGEGEPGDYAALTPEIGMQLRYEGAAPVWMAAAMGSAAAPVVLSSQAANSLVAAQHVLTLAARPSKFLTLACDMGNPSQYVLESPAVKVRGFSVKVGENGRMDVSFPCISAKANYDSTTNTNSTVGGVAAQTLSSRLYRNTGTFRMNLQSAGSLVASDAVTIAKDLSFSVTVPMTQDDVVFGQDYIIEPDVDGFPEFPVEITYAAMNTVSANSMAFALKTGGIFKADLTFTGAYINSTTRRSLVVQWPALQIYTFKAEAASHGKIRPTATFRAKQASAAPSGMAFTQPIRLTWTNANSLNLLS